jgi:Transposase
MTYKQITEYLWPREDVSPASIRYILYKRGYTRRVALRKPTLTEKNKKKRLT